MTDRIVGKTINDRYHIISMIGQGGMTRTYKALDTRIGRFVAIKTLQSRFENDEEYIQRFLHESRVLAKLQNPNITQIYECKRTGDSIYIIMEYIEGSSLAEVIAQRGPQHIEYAIEILRQIGKGLSYLHEHGFIHRDIKPSNILVSNSGRVVISDLGLAIAPRISTITDTGTILGTPAYMSPEQAVGDPLTPSTDIYSLAVVFYELLTGQSSFAGQTTDEILRQVVHEPPLFLKGEHPQITKTLDQVLSRALAKSPNQRYQSVNTFIDALDKALDEVSEYSYTAKPTQIPEVVAAYPKHADAQKQWAPPSPNINVQSRHPRLLLWGLAMSGLIFVMILTLFYGSRIVKSIRSHPFLSLFIALGISVALLTLIIMKKKRHSPPQSTQAPPMCRMPSSPPADPRKSTGLHPQFQRNQIGSETRGTIPYSEPPVPRTMRLRQDATAWLLALNGKNRGRQFQLSKNSTIGRDPTKCDIVIDDSSISGLHSRIKLQKDQFYIYDLASTNGTFINGVQVNINKLSDRDEIQIGKTVMLFVRIASPEDLTAEAKRRLREFSSVWDQLAETVHND